MTLRASTFSCSNTSKLSSGYSRISKTLIHRCTIKATMSHRACRTTQATVKKLIEEPREDHGVVVILGATATGKSKLSIDIGTRFPIEIINSDKMQFYHGLDITTNKLPVEERRGIPHHLHSNFILADNEEITASRFRLLASETISDIWERGKTPVVVGGSNSYVHALLAAEHKEGYDIFGMDNEVVVQENLSRHLRYKCCMLWVDAKLSVLEEYIDKRVDDMIARGVVIELARHYNEKRTMVGYDYKGLDKSIGVPEFDKFFCKYPMTPAALISGKSLSTEEKSACEAAVDEMKYNTRVLARRQIEKIKMLRSRIGYKILRLDATEAIVRKLQGKVKEEVEEAWHSDVLRPAIAEVAKFLDKY